MSRYLNLSEDDRRRLQRIIDGQRDKWLDSQDRSTKQEFLAQLLQQALEQTQETSDKLDELRTWLESKIREIEEAI